MKHLIAIICLSLISSAAFADRNCTKEEKAKANERLMVIHNSERIKKEIARKHAPFRLPLNTGNKEGERILFQDGYIMAYDDELLTTLWVTYRLTKDDVDAGKGKERVNCFRRDPRIKLDSDSAMPEDYQEPWFDQGHITNDRDLKDSLIEQINTYVMTNISPQHCHFNRGIWLATEHLARQWAKEYKTLFVTSGAIFDKDGENGRDIDAQANRMKSNNGKSRVAIPTHYYKVFMRPTESAIYTYAFMIPHDNTNRPDTWAELETYFIQYSTTLEAIEQKAGVRLLPTLDRNKLRQNRSYDWDTSMGGGTMDFNCKTI